MGKKQTIRHNTAYLFYIVWENEDVTWSICTYNNFNDALEACTRVLRLFSYKIAVSYGVKELTIKLNQQIAP